MRRTTRDLSTSEIAELATAFGIDVGDSELDDLKRRVNRRLDGLDEVYEIPIDAPDVPGDRRWSKPTAEFDPYNAVVTACEIEPTDDGALSGLTVGIKDNIAVAGVPMQCGSAVMEGFTPVEDAPVVTRLLEAGATITAKTNLDEFAGGGRGMAADGQIRHPMDPDRYPAGSSGGSAAAVAAGQVDIALGTDTGGSVRAPAAVCGLVGAKATYGLVPIAGVIENTYSLDHVGVLARTVSEAAACLDALAGKHERDPGSMAAAGHDEYTIGGYADAAADPIDPADLTLGRLVESFEDGETAVLDHVSATLDDLDAAGATVVDISLPEADLVDTIKNCITYPELAQYWRDGGVPLRRGGGETRDQVGFARR
ncbi:MAG: amidase family protein, partial [Halobacteriota archaeon]